MEWLANSVEVLAKQASEITLYDIKAAANKAKAMVLNLSEMETMVREATNDDAWGASSTLMQQIAQATHNFQLFNEIMPTIYQRFTEKEARQWRQIYKSLVLLEYLVKNGSERVIDDARAHMSLIKVLRNFHYTDEASKDQGINVRNRSKELAELLSDLDRVRQERKKAKSNRNKYTGVSSESSFGSGGGGGGGGGPSFISATGSRYGGFGSDSMEGGSGGGGGGRSGGFTDSSARAGEFEEYDAGDWEDTDRRRGSGISSEVRASSSRPAPIMKATPATPKQPAAPKQEVNLFDFDDDEPAPAAVAAPLSFSAPAPVASAGLDDDFDDFQSAPTAPSAPAATSSHQNVFALLNATQPAPTPAQQPSYGGFAPLQAQPARPPMQQQTSSFAALTPSSPARPTTQQKPVAASKPADDFSDLFSFGGTSAPKPSNGTGGQNGAGPKLSMAQLAEKTRQDQLFKASGGNSGQMGGWDSLM